MHIKITRATLSTALSSVLPAVDSKGLMPVIQNVKVSAKDNTATFICTNLDITLSAKAECKVLEEGSTTIPAKLFSAAINKMVEGEIDIETNKNEVSTIEAGSAKFRMSGLPASEFPELPQVSGEEMVIQGKDFREFIRKTVYALSVDTTRKVVTGMLLDFHEDGITAVGTDGRRLARVNASLESPANQVFRMILPRKAVDVLKAMLPKEGDVSIVRVTSQVMFKFGNQEVTTRLIDDTYPHYDNAIPANLANRITIPRADLLAAIDRVSVFAKENGESIAMGLEFKNNLAVLTTDIQGQDSARDEVPVKYDGEPITTKVNPTYVKDVLSALDDDEIEIDITDGSKPMVFKTIDSDAFLYVLMPLRVG